MKRFSKCRFNCNGKTVGLPAGNPANLERKITTPGVQLPIRKEVYQPILKELEEYGVVFKEESYLLWL
jgi:hypothetical protein